MKKVLALFLALALIASVFSVAASAETVSGDSAVVNLYTFGVKTYSKTFSVGDVFTVYTSLDLAGINDGNVSGFAGSQTFDPSVLSLIDETDEYGLIKDASAMLPVAGSFGMAGYNGSDTLKFNASNPALNDGLKFNSPDSYLVISTYTVIAPGTVDISTNLTTLALSDFALTRVINKSEFKSPYTSDQVTMTSAFEEYTEPQPVLFMLGDIDGDEDITAVDATYAQRHATMIKVPYSSEHMLTRGDVDSDGDLTVVDATYILRYSTMIKVPVPVGEYVSQ